MSEITQFFEPGGKKPLPRHKCEQYSRSFKEAEARFKDAEYDNEGHRFKLRHFLDTFYAALTTKGIVNHQELRRSINQYEFIFTSEFLDVVRNVSPESFDGMSRLQFIANEIIELYKIRKEPPLHDRENVVEFKHP